MTLLSLFLLSDPLVIAPSLCKTDQQIVLKHLDLPKPLLSCEDPIIRLSKELKLHTSFEILSKSTSFLNSPVNRMLPSPVNVKYCLSHSKFPQYCYLSSVVFPVSPVIHTVHWDLIFLPLLQFMHSLSLEGTSSYIAQFLCIHSIQTDSTCTYVP